MTAVLKYIIPFEKQRMRQSMKTILIAVLTATAMYAGTETITLLGTSNVQNSQGAYVLPYTLGITVNGVTTQVLADCYSSNIQMSIGEKWQANVIPFGLAVTQGALSKDPNAAGQYEFLAAYSIIGSNLEPSDTADQVALQQDMWDITDPNEFKMTANMAKLWTEAFNMIPNGDFGHVLFVEPSTPGMAQPFVLEGPPAGVPEPVSSSLIGLGLVGLAAWRKRK